jgi:hypothetical protein
VSGGGSGASGGRGALVATRSGQCAMMTKVLRERDRERESDRERERETERPVGSAQC